MSRSGATRDERAPFHPPPTYEFRVRKSGWGWWAVEIHYATKPSPWEMVARVFGEKRAEICRDALSAEANERV